ncbi:MAG: metallophosphoesterase [Leptospiraceae bacterium]|nr:metallophosphoesterase [Leptospiraceae bacterium]
MYRFLITATILVLLGIVYIGHRLVQPEWPLPVRAALWIVLIAMVANLLWLPFKRWQRRSGAQLTGPMTRVLEASAYNLMGFLSLLLLFTALSEFFRIFLRAAPDHWVATVAMALPRGWHYDSILALTIIALAMFFFFWGRTAVALGPRYRFVKVVYPLAGTARRRPRFGSRWSRTRRDAATRHVRIAQVSDLHIGRAIKKHYVEKVAGMISAQNADIACFTGDIGDGDVTALVHDAAPLAGIRTKHGTYYIPGNHEYYWGISTWLTEFKKLGMHLLINRGEIVKTENAKLFVAGISDPTAARFAADLPQIPERADSDLAILLAHQPIFARSAEQKQYDLMLSGHTHGGQYIPWSWVVHLVYRFASGLYRFGRMLVYVNDGTGYWGAPLRVGTRLEITIIDIYIKGDSDASDFRQSEDN